MKCPHCGINFHENWIEDSLSRRGKSIQRSAKYSQYSWVYRTAICPGPQCGNVTIELGYKDNRTLGLSTDGGTNFWQVFPVGSSRGPISNEVPPDIATDYVEACTVLPHSAKASAALSRRCLQNILHANGYKGKDLYSEINALLNEPDPKKALPNKIRETIDAIRNFGNFSAHPINDVTSLQVIDVEDHEAEWCLEILEDLFEHFYVGPALANERKNALNAKLAAGGKKPAK